MIHLHVCICVRVCTSEYSSLFSMEQNQIGMKTKRKQKETWKYFFSDALSIFGSLSIPAIRCFSLSEPENFQILCFTLSVACVSWNRQHQQQKHQSEYRVLKVNIFFIKLSVLINRKFLKVFTGSKIKLSIVKVIKSTDKAYTRLQYGL